MFAETAAEVISWVVGTAGLVSAVAAAIVLVLNARHKNRQERDRTAVEQYREVADRLERTVERLQSHVGQQQEAIEQLAADEADCRVDLAELYGAAALMNDFARRMASCCRQLGSDPGDPPALPPRPPRGDRRAQEVQRRTLAQNTALLQQPPGGTS